MKTNLPPKPTMQNPLYEALGSQYAQDHTKVKQIMQKRNPRYEPKRPTLNRGMRATSLDEVFL